MTTFTTEDRLKAEATVLEGQQNQFQTKYGALAYETPCRDVSNENFCADSYGCTHGEVPLEPCPKSHNEPQK
jgi:membrane protease subunit (stomatin/prohibitin family)